MRRDARSGFTLPELIVVIVVGMIVAVFLLLWRTRANEKSDMIACAANLRTIGQAMQLYAQDNLRLGGVYPRLHFRGDAANIVDSSGSDLGGAWTATSSDPFNESARDGSGAGRAAEQTAIGYNNIPAALFLLARTQNLPLKTFICPATLHRHDDLQRGGAQRQLRECGNFGSVRQNLSYAYANPYPPIEAITTGYRLTAASRPDFAIMADMGPGTSRGQNPYGVIDPAGSAATATSPWQQQRTMNSNNHARKGQNVLFADGHVEFVTTVFVGIKGNHIYVPDTSENGSTVYRTWLGEAKEAKVKASRASNTSIEGAAMESAFDPALNQSAPPGNTTNLKGANAKPCSGQDSVLLPWESDN